MHINFPCLLTKIFNVVVNISTQDRSVWDQDLALKEFSKTAKLMIDNKVPSCECFFAKQGPRSGLKPHSDKNNFIITCHLALDVPEGECWIQVGNEKHYWKNGKTCVFDTSVIHSTENASDRVRYVLLIRFWHPDLTADEIDAFKFIFDFLDHAALGEAELEVFEYRQLMGKDNHVDLQIDNSSKGHIEKSESSLSRQQKRAMARKSHVNDVTLTKEKKKLNRSFNSPTKGFGAKK